MTKPKAAFTYHIESLFGRNCIIIIDTAGDRAIMSVTNDIENVVKYIGEKENVNLFEYTIIYKDSTGTWDGWSEKYGFIALRRSRKEDAIGRYIELQLNTDKI